jgi:hypothetical protein
MWGLLLVGTEILKFGPDASKIKDRDLVGCFNIMFLYVEI